MPRVLVTGGAGFIGSHLADGLTSGLGMRRTVLRIFQRLGNCVAITRGFFRERVEKLGRMERGGCRSRVCAIRSYETEILASASGALI